MNKVFWASRQNISPSRSGCIRELYGDDVLIEHDPVEFSTPKGLSDYTSKAEQGTARGGVTRFRIGYISRPLPLVWTDADPIQLIEAVTQGRDFGFFKEDPSGSLSAYVVVSSWNGDNDVSSELLKVWSNAV